MTAPCTLLVAVRARPGCPGQGWSKGAGGEAEDQPPGQWTRGRVRARERVPLCAIDILDSVYIYNIPTLTKLSIIYGYAPSHARVQ